MRVLFVCIGNINRSKAAEIVTARSKPGFVARSCGVRDGRYNVMITRQMAEALKSFGFDVDRNAERSQRVTQELVDWADVIVPMTSGINDRLSRAVEKPDSFKVHPHFLGGGIKDPHFDSSGRMHIAVMKDIIKMVDEVCQ